MFQSTKAQPLEHTSIQYNYRLYFCEMKSVIYRKINRIGFSE
jgi:hypothetical protein